MVPAALFAEAARRIEACRRVLITTHTRADGDAVGSAMGLARALRARGTEATVLLLDSLPKRYAFLVADDAPAVWGESFDASRAGRFDAVVVVDTCAWRQLEPIESFLRSFEGLKIAVDHHATRDELADIYLVDASAPAAAELILQWCRSAGWTVGPAVAALLFVGLATDTGWFRFANADARSFTVAASLIEAGAQPDRLHQAIYGCEPAHRIRLIAEMLASLELHCDGRLAVVQLTQAAFQRAGASPAETEDLINELQRLDGMVAAVMLVELEGNLTRLSLRSRRDVDVSAVAARFGGGGHARAAGARIRAGLADAKGRVVQALETELNTGT